MGSEFKRNAFTILKIMPALEYITEDDRVNVNDALQYGLSSDEHALECMQRTYQEQETALGDFERIYQRLLANVTNISGPIRVEDNVRVVDENLVPKKRFDHSRLVIKPPAKDASAVEIATFLHETRWHTKKVIEAYDVSRRDLYTANRKMRELLGIMAAKVDMLNRAVAIDVDEEDEDEEDSAEDSYDDEDTVPQKRPRWEGGGRVYIDVDEDDDEDEPQYGATATERHSMEVMGERGPLLN